MSKWAAIAEAAKQKSNPVPKVPKGAESLPEGLLAPFGVLARESKPENPVSGGADDAGPESAKPAPKQPHIQPTVSTPQTPEDWHDFYEERAAIAEYDGGLSRAEAETLAFECCLSAWRNSHPPQSDPGTCPQCGQQIPADGAGCVPVLAGPDMHVWIHDRCHEPWVLMRRRQAEVALAELSVGGT